VERRETEARAEPDPIAAEIEVSPSEPETLLRNREALTEPPSINIGNAGAVANGHAQADVPRLVGAPNRLEQRAEALCDSPGVDPEEAEAVQDLAEDVKNQCRSS
jgi:hypothetical protein